MVVVVVVGCSLHCTCRDSLGSWEMAVTINESVGCAVDAAFVTAASVTHSRRSQDIVREGLQLLESGPAHDTESDASDKIHSSMCADLKMATVDCVLGSNGGG